MEDCKKLGEILVDLQVLTSGDVDRIVHALRLRHGRAKFGQVGKEMGLLREEHILAALAVQLELFPNVQEMTLQRLLGRLADPVCTPPRLARPLISKHR